MRQWPRILITGGAGYIGSVLVQKFIESKKAWTLASYDSVSVTGASKFVSPGKWPHGGITVYDNLMYGQSPLVNYCYHDDFRFVRGDVRDEEKLLKEIKNADIIIPLAAIVGAPACDKDPELAQQVNHDHITFICENMNPGTKLIYPNTNSGYGVGEDGKFCTEESPLNPISHYGRTKCAAEKEVLAAEGVVFRLATVFGLSQRPRLDLLVNDFTWRAKKDGFLVLFEADFKRNYIHVQDVALAFIRAIIDWSKFRRNVFNLGLSKANLSKMELAEKIKEHVPDLTIIRDEFGSDPDKRDYIVSNEKLERTGWFPSYSLENGIEELLKGYDILQKNQFTNL
jgi:nucleoside-diphosphate-sugar epimerase